MFGKDVEDGNKDIQWDSDCMLCFDAQCICLTDNVYKALANSDSIWERKLCRKTEWPDLNSMIMWTLSLSIPAKHVYANTLMYSCYPFPIKKAKDVNVKTIIWVSPKGNLAVGHFAITQALTVCAKWGKIVQGTVGKVSGKCVSKYLRAWRMYGCRNTIFHRIRYFSPLLTGGSQLLFHVCGR